MQSRSCHTDQATRMTGGPNPDYGARDFDILILADMALRSDCGLRIRREVQCCFDQGYRVGLLHLPRFHSASISPDVQRCVREGLAVPLSAGGVATAKLAIVISPGHFTEPVPGLAEVRADRVILVHDRPPDVERMGVWHSFDFGKVSWAPTNRWIRSALVALDLPVPLEEADWRPIGRPVPPGGNRKSGDRRPVAGFVEVPWASQWPDTCDRLRQIYPADLAIDFRILGEPPAELVKEKPLPQTWNVLQFDDTSVERFIEMLDVLMCFPEGPIAVFPDAAICTAMASGKVVVLPRALQPHFGPGAIYCEPEDASRTVIELVQDPEALAQARQTAVEGCALQFSEPWHRERVAAFLGRTRPSKPRRRAKPRQRRALMVPSNGVGLGHVTRLLAITRRMDAEVEPLFATMAAAAPIIESFGYAAEYIPSHGYVRSSLKVWDDWFRHELGEIVEWWNPDVVVYDGNIPTPGLVHSVLSNGRPRLIWVRRGMACPTPSPYLENSGLFDCIIEPGEIAGERDTGPTAVRRYETIAVPPIRLLDGDELLPHSEARAALGLDPDRPAVLLHTGGSANRDAMGLLDGIIRTLGSVSGLQIVVAEWGNSAAGMPFWPQTRVLRGYPISRYFNAFDLSVAAAGYNTYHEVIAFGLPTIFVANRHPSMDDQGGRAEFAQDNGIGFDLAENQLFYLPALCEALLNEKANTFMRNRCLQFKTPNGAADAAEIIGELAAVP